jgi:hypothetical protein
VHVPGGDARRIGSRELGEKRLGRPQESGEKDGEAGGAAHVRTPVGYAIDDGRGKQKVLQSFQRAHVLQVLRTTREQVVKIRDHEGYWAWSLSVETTTGMVARVYVGRARPDNRHAARVNSATAATR